MWKYAKRYLPYAVLAAAFMVGKVLIDLLQPELMSRIVDDGVLSVHTGGVGGYEPDLGVGPQNDLSGSVWRPLRLSEQRFCAYDRAECRQ